MTTLMLIFCWQGDEDRIARHYPFWTRAVGESMWFICPADAPVRTVNERVIAFGRSEQFGAELIRRMIHGMETALNESDAKRFIVLESDALTFRSEWDKWPEGFWGVNKPNGNPELFRAKTYVHFPWVMDRMTIARVVAAMQDLPADAELGFADRHVAWACDQAGIEIHDHPELWSCNQIDQPGYMAGARLALKGALSGLHGVKTEGQLEQLFEP